ncbi:MAG: hypothetical protein HOI23_14385 [Deltaproteobacteria bacterium]|nr:hypothetical protein [Deltaproteobacteria bacterium]
MTRIILNRVVQLLLIIGLAFSSTACGSWETKEDWRGGIWADDEQAVLAFKDIFERRREFGASNYSTRNHRLQVFTAQANNLNSRTAIGPRLPGILDSAWFMNSAGYLIVGHTQPVSEEFTEGNYRYQRRNIIFQKMTLDGSTTEIASSNAIYMKGCNGAGSMSGVIPAVQVIPSPDGDVLAVVETSEDCTSMSGTLTFKNANDLSNIGDSYILNLELSQNAFAFLDLGTAWLDSNEFFVGQGSGFGQFTFSGFKYTPNQPAVAVQGLGESCLMPQTTSGLNWKSYLNVNDSGISEGSAYDMEFGCAE